MTEFAYGPMFPLSRDDTPYRRLTERYVSTINVDGHEVRP